MSITRMPAVKDYSFLGWNRRTVSYGVMYKHWHSHSQVVYNYHKKQWILKTWVIVKMNKNYIFLNLIHIQDLHVVFVSYWDIETAIPSKGSVLSHFLIDTVFICLLVLPVRWMSAVTPFGKGEAECREAKRL